MILDRAIYACAAVIFSIWTIRSVRSGESLLFYKSTKRADDPLMFWAGIVMSAFVAAGLIMLVFKPVPLGEALQITR